MNYDYRIKTLPGIVKDILESMMNAEGDKIEPMTVDNVKQLLTIHKVKFNSDQVVRQALDRLTELGVIVKHKETSLSTKKKVTYGYKCVMDKYFKEEQNEPMPKV